MKNEIGYARRVNQKLICAELLLALPSAESDRFAVQSLVEAVYLQLELALGFYAAEVFAKYGIKAVASRGDTIDLDGLTAFIQNPTAQMFEINELKVLMVDSESWFSHCIAVCRSLRCVPDQKTRMKSSIFDNTKESSPKDSNLITIAGVTETESELSVHVAQSTVRSLSEFIERNRAAGVEC